WGAIAVRRTGAPRPGGYWLTPLRIASIAASITSCGASVSGNPCPRLTESVATARADISAKMVVPNPARREVRAPSTATTTGSVRGRPFGRSVRAPGSGPGARRARSANAVGFGFLRVTPAIRTQVLVVHVFADDVDRDRVGEPMGDAGRLGLVHRKVGGAHQFVEGLTVPGIERGTDGARHRHVTDDRRGAQLT